MTVDWLVVDVDVPPVVKPVQRLGGEGDGVDGPAGRAGVEAGDEVERRSTLPFRTFKPLNEAALTASVSCWPSEASEVLMLPMLAPGSVACVSAVWIELMVVMTELIAELAVARSD